MEQDDWKEKYKQLAADMDAVQERLNDRSLDHLVYQMSGALEGRSELLDRALAALCEQLKNGQDVQNEDTFQLVEKQLRTVGIEHEKHNTDLLQALHKWIRQLRLQLTTELSIERLTKAESALVSLRAKEGALPGILNDLVALQAPLLTTDLSETLNVTANSSDAAHADDSKLLQQIGVELLSLLTGLCISKDETPKSRDLARRIEEGLTLAGLPEIIQDLVKLIATLSNNNSADFENYLLNLTGQLAEVQAYLIENQKEDLANGQAAKLSQDIHHDVQAISLAVSNSHDLHELKNEVSSQLLNIVESVDAYKRNEEDREKQLQKRYEQMNSRLEQMEQQTQLMTEHIETERQRAMTDALTSLPNRAGYDDQIEAEFERWKRYQHHFSIVVADLDHFKRINDSFGHQAGDKVLKLIANVLTRKCRTTDFVARYGGEEFVILMPSTNAEKSAQGVDKIRKAIESSPFNFHGKPVQITMSFGVAEIQEGDTVESLFARADKALYSAKGNGRNRIELG
ncbi:GGDEF domain-containing protein [Amphritea balenae]|uniref:diguanylate cyclase n=1 Tax=Amphritea balenae TaxID=452629 RepID=A0A3P1SNP5_9GAMM|nr:GGDEF domain-containing protein [Amphritea balenae]RRC98776.1 GGDEF domain-containing protein [Amphritea balenae]GGK61541.1 hypothetical protein GCM10007941_09650 [Amphritea balenae]